MTKKPAGGLEHLTLSDLLPERAIEMQLEAQDRRQTIDWLLERLEGTGIILDRQQAAEDLWTREIQGSTGLGRGVALPHAKTRAACEPALAFGRSEQGVDFQSLDGQPAHLVFLFVAPRTRAGLHLKVLSTLSRYLREEEHRKQLLEASGPDEIRRLLTGILIR